MARLLNPDAFPEADWLEELLAAAAKKPGYSFFASRLVMAADPDRLDAAGDVLHVSGVAWPRDRGVASSAAPDAGEVFSASAAAAPYRRRISHRRRLRRTLLLPLRGRRFGLPPAPGRSPLLVRVDRCGEARRSGNLRPRRRLLLPHTPQHGLWTLRKTCRRRSSGSISLSTSSSMCWSCSGTHGLGRSRLLLQAKLDAIRGLPAVLSERRLVQGRRVVSSHDLRMVMAKARDVVFVL